MIRMQEVFTVTDEHRLEVLKSVPSGIHREEITWDYKIYVEEKVWGTTPPNSCGRKSGTEPNPLDSPCSWTG